MLVSESEIFSRVNIYILTSLHRQVKSVAALAGTSMSQFFSVAAREKLARDKAGIDRKAAE